MVNVVVNMKDAETESCYPAGVPVTGQAASGTVVADSAERSAAGAAGAAGTGGGHPRAVEPDRGVQLLPECGHTVPVALHCVQDALQRAGPGQPGHGAGGQSATLPAEPEPALQLSSLHHCIICRVNLHSGAQPNRLQW